MIADGAWRRNPATQALCAMLTGAGFRAYFVGGCLRDALMGREVGDIDIATDAPPARVMELAAGQGMRALPTGIDHGTVTVVAGGLAHEVTTLRRDVATDGRRAQVAFTAELAEDAARRDFTINALYATPAGEVIDPLGGIADIRARRVRFVGEPSARIAEDALRILRFFRFHATHGDASAGLDPEGLAAAAAAAGAVATLSRERVGAEMRKLLAAPDPAPAVAAMAHAGVLAQALPGADAGPLAALVHLEGGHPGGWLRRLAVLGGEDPARDLRLSRAEAAALARIGGAARGGAGPGELGYRLGAAGAEDALLVRAALLGQAPPPGAQDEAARGAAARFPLAASDLMPALSGEALGQALRRAEALWIGSGFALGAADLRRALAAGEAGP